MTPNLMLSPSSPYPDRGLPRSECFLRAGEPAGEDTVRALSSDRTARL